MSLSSSQLKAKLYLVPTPVGNLADMTYRAVETLKSSDIILCEDTRTSSYLLKYYEIDKKMMPYHKMNEHKETEKIVQWIQAGQIVSLISDAGTPTISDPGHLLVAKCVEQGIDVECLPGATAFVPALVNSGFDISSFMYLGFPPHKKGRQTFAKALNDYKTTVVLYESPHRLMKFFDEFKEFVGETRRLSVSREISKKFEETRRGTVDELIAHFTIHPPKGEFVVVIEGEK